MLQISLQPSACKGKYDAVSAIISWDYCCKNKNLLYMGNFSHGSHFRWVRDLPEIDKIRHSE